MDVGFWAFRLERILKFRGLGEGLRLGKGFHVYGVLGLGDFGAV